MTRQHKKDKTKSAQKVKDLIGGTVGGVVQVLVGQPFDIVKVRLQSQSRTNPQYSGVGDCFKQILAKEGPKGYYKGTLPPLVGNGAAVSVQFAVMESAKRWMSERNKGSPLSSAQFFICGSLAGFANSFITTPVEHIRIRMQIQSQAQGLYKNSIHCAKTIFSQEGIRGLFKGGAPNICREVYGYGLYFSSYELAVRALTPEGKSVKDLGVFQLLAAGSVAGIMMWTLGFHFDTIKTKIQSDAFNNPKYTGMADCIAQTFKGEGIRGFYRGYGACLMRAVPVNAGSFVGFEMTMRLLGRDVIV